MKNCFANTPTLQTKPLEITFENSSLPEGTQVTVSVIGDTGTQTVVITVDANGRGTATLDPTPAGWTFCSLEAGGCTPWLVDFN